MESNSQTARASTGCWTCKVRHKKCDGSLPTCQNCTSLLITCHQSQTRPDWMDGGLRQERMAQEVKLEVKQNAHRRRGEHSISIFSMQPSTEYVQNGATFSTREASIPPKEALVDLEGGSNLRQVDGSNSQLGRTDAMLISFYLENLFPFFFPFHQPSGGRAWMMELIFSSPVLRQVILCQSSYYLSLAQDASDGNGAWEKVLSQTQDAFEMLGRALTVINGQGIKQSLHGAVRILTSILLLQRFEFAIMNFTNCHAHLDAAVVLFRHILETEKDGHTQIECARSSFDAVLDRLGPSKWTLLNHDVSVPSAEQAAFRFSSALLVFQDILASTVLQQPPKLYEWHDSLLVNRFDSSGPAIDLKGITGCENRTMIQIGHIASLNAWKQAKNSTGALDMTQLVQRANLMKDSLSETLLWLEMQSASGRPLTSPPTINLLDAFRAQRPAIAADQELLITKVWTYAAITYHLMVLSDEEPSPFDAKRHVDRVIEALSQVSPAGLRRTMTWPFCVAGCLADSAQVSQLRDLARTLQPPNLFSTLNKALETAIDGRNFAACFERENRLILLV